MGNNSWESPKGYTSQNSERNLDYISSFIAHRIGHNLWYCHLVHPVFLDMTKFAKVFATDFSWAWAFPMVSGSEAHDTLLLLCTWGGASPAHIRNMAKEMIQGKLYQKLKDAIYQLNQLDHLVLGQILQKTVKDLKGASCKLLWSRAPRCLWDDCLKLETNIRIKTVHEF